MLPCRPEVEAYGKLPGLLEAQSGCHGFALMALGRVFWEALRRPIESEELQLARAELDSMAQRLQQLQSKCAEVTHVAMRLEHVKEVLGRLEQSERKESKLEEERDVASALLGAFQGALACH